MNEYLSENQKYKQKIFELVEDDDDEKLFLMLNDCTTSLDQLTYDKLYELIKIKESYQKSRGFNLMHFGAYLGRLKMIKKILIDNDDGNDVLKKTMSNGESLLHFAAHKGHLDVVKFLIEEVNMDENGCTETGHSVVHFAAKGKQMKVLKYLIESKGCDVFRRVKENGNEDFCLLDYFTNEEDILELKKLILKKRFFGFKNDLKKVVSLIGNNFFSNYFEEMKEEEILKREKEEMISYFEKNLENEKILRGIEKYSN